MNYYTHIRNLALIILLTALPASIGASEISGVLTAGGTAGSEDSGSLQGDVGGSSGCLS